MSDEDQRPDQPAERPDVLARIRSGSNRIADVADRFGRRAHGGMRAAGTRLRLDAIQPRHVLIAAALSVAFAGLTWSRCGLVGCPDVSVLAAYQPGEAPVLLDASGRQFASLTPVPRSLVALDSLPRYVGDAFVAVEDRRFFEHNGVDWRRVVGAAIRDIQAGAAVEGSSTLTMQLARTAFPARMPAAERSMRRKLLEVRVARSIERHYDKREILELYLNHIYLGGGAYGVEAGSEYWFGKSATKLTLPQAAMLAALPRGPAIYDPRRYPDRATARRGRVLAAMEAQGYASDREVAAATEAKLGVMADRPASGTSPGFAPYFVEAVRTQLEERFGDELYTSRLRVYTTLDQTAQRAAEEELVAQLRRIEKGTYGRFRAGAFEAASGAGEAGSEYLQGAVVMMEAATGDVVALVGGRDWAHSRFDRALVGKRQAGSAFKPFVYAAALSDGYAASQPVADRPFSLPIPGSRTWEPRNFDNRFDGMMSMRRALAQSRNVPAARVAAAVGVAEIAQLAHRAGIVSDIPEQPAMALGVASVTPIELVSAYTAFAGGGTGSEARFITRVESRDSVVVWATDVVHRDVLEPEVAFVLTSMLSDVVDRGTARSVRSVGFGGAAAGKTGTTTDGNDAWFVGYTPDLVAGVWIGFDQPQPIVSNASGGSLAAPVWGRVMRRVYAKRRSPAVWRAPAGVIARRIDPATGLVLADECFPREGDATREFFIANAKPLVVCPRREERRRRGWLADIIGALADGLGFSHDDPAYQEYEAILAGMDDPRTKEEQLLGARRLPLEEAGGRRVEVRSDRDQRRRLAGPPGRTD